MRWVRAIDGDGWSRASARRLDRSRWWVGWFVGGIERIGRSAASKGPSRASVALISAVCVTIACKRGDSSNEPSARQRTLSESPLESSSEAVASDDAEKRNYPPEDPLALPIDLAGLSITLERRGDVCYQVVIEGTGHVRYSGRARVKQLGESWGLVGDQVVRDLIEAFRQNDFVRLRDSYQELDTAHLPTTYLTLQVGKWRKQVENRWQGTDVAGPFHRAPDRDVHMRLDTLALAIDRSVDIERWIGTESEREALHSR